jgi:hypothetical protein
MEIILNVAVLLFFILEMLSFFFIYRILSGDGPPYVSKWAEVFKGILGYILAVIVLQLLAYGLLWLSSQMNIRISPFPGSIYTWGLRLSALFILWRVIRPRREWAQDQTPPSHLRLKLAACALLAVGLSFLPVT